MTSLQTPRLILRQWRPGDREPFAALNADPEVMRYFPDTLTVRQSDELAARLHDTIAAQGWGLWALELRAGARFAGFVGLNAVPFEARFTPAVEVGWRLDRSAWGHGYATEAAALALRFGFRQLGREQIVSFTAAINERSIGVMRRLLMVRDPDEDFDHPNVPHGPLRRHVLFRISAEANPVGG